MKTSGGGPTPSTTGAGKGVDRAPGGGREFATALPNTLALATSTRTGLSIGTAADAEYCVAEDGVYDCVSDRLVEVSLTREPVFA